MPYISEASWAIIDISKQSIKAKIENKGRLLKNRGVKINFGIKTGLNEIFIINKNKRDEPIKNHHSAKNLIRPLLRGRTIDKYITKWDGDFIIATFPALKINIENYPSIKQYLIQYRPKIDQIGEEFVNAMNQKEKTRKKTSNSWFETQDQIGYVNEFTKEKIIWKRIGSQLRFSYSNEEIYCLDSTCIATGEKVKYLTALLNSKLCNYELFENAPRTGMGDLIISVQALEPLHVYYPSDEVENQILNILGNILTVKKSNPQASTLQWEAEIDARVFQLYGLTEDEINQVLSSLPKVTEEEKLLIVEKWRSLEGIK
jgi:adenine-specific DNA-methyltransferase